MKVIKNKKIIYFLCFCVFDLLFIMTSAFSYFPKAQILAVSVPKVSIYSNNIKDGYVKNIDYTSVSLYIESDIAPTSDIEVYYRTYDETAIAKSGDYTSTDTYVILTPTSYHKEITISTKIAGFNVTYLGGDNLRTFGVEIYKVDGNAEIDSSKNSIRCALREMAEIGAINKNGVITLNDYVEGSTQNISESQTFYDETPNFVKISETSSSLYTKLNFIYSYENLADMYFSASGILDESASYWTASESWPFVVRFSYSDISDGNTLYQSGYYNLDNSTVYLGKNSSDYGIKDVYEYVDKRQIVVARNNVDSGNYYYMRNNDLIISLMSNTGRDRTFNNWKTEFIMFDKTTPTISSYYIEPIISSKKIRLAIRFSEPIHTDNPSSLQLNAYPNGTNNATSNLHFNYVGGNFTDTLYFDCDMSSYNYQTNISYLQFSTQNGFNSIYDFAYDENGRNYQFHSSDISLVNKFDCSYDTRTPVITTSSTSLSTVSKNHIVGVTTQKMDNSGYVEYTWTNSTDVPSSYDNKNIVTPTNFSINPQNFTGTYYLHLKATSAYGKSSQDVCIGPANFDNSSPTISNLVVPDASYSLDKRNITFNIEDIGLAGINNITLEYSKVYSSETKTLIIYSSSSSTNKVTLTSNQAEFLLTATDLGLGTNEYADYNLKIYADDKVGNVSAIISANSVKFDTRSLNSQVTMTPGQSEYFSNGNVKVYALNSHFDFELTNGSATELIPNVIYNGNVVSTNEYFTSTTSTNTVSITPTKSGLYEISLCVVVGTETSYTTSYQFYIYQDNDVTGNKSNLDNFNVLINKLYKLDSVKYYYKDKNGIVVSENYFNTSINYFSTYDKLFNYVYYYELQDLYAYEIPTDSVASSFNSNSSEYRKADGESISASKGQVWIRYKRSGWDSSSQTGDWVYYFYSNSNNNEISTSLISSNLQLALYTVSTKIASKGVITYLTSYDGLDSYGSPKVSSSEIHPIDENISKTKTGQLYSNSISFIGDSDIYLSTIESLGKTLKYATGYTFVSNNYTHLYYGSYDGNEVLNDNYIEIQNFDGARLSSIINGTGIYEILEVDDKGMSKFLVYVDNSAPSIEVNYSRLDGTSENNFVIGKESDNTTLNVATLSLQKIINEIDPLSYIAVFNSSYYSLYGVYSNEDLTSSEVALPQGRWYIEIYDRAGNHFVINVRINNTTLNCSYVLRQNVSITFKCDRTENDIFSYQIWRDNVLIQSNYTNDITFKTTGTYHIRVEDWYGNIYDKEVSLSRVSPESNLSWKYEIGTTYYDYDSTNPTGMKLTRLGTNKYSVTSSGNLQIIYDSSCDYSYKVEGDATITSSTNVGKVRITIITGSDWTITIYYTSDENVSVSYTGSKDNSAPTIGAITIDDEYSFADNQQITNAYNNYSGVDKQNINIDSIAMNKTGKQIIGVINNDSSIQAKLISISISDDSDIVSVKIWLDDDLIVNNTSYSSAITLSRPGKYKIEATDYLGNKSTFNFVNVVNIDREVYIDSVKSNDSSLYGNDFVLYKVNKDENIVLLEESDSQRKYYSFYFDGTNLKLIYNYNVQSISGNKTVLYDSDVLSITNVSSLVANQVYNLSTQNLQNFKAKYLGGGKFYITNFDETNVFGNNLELYVSNINGTLNVQLKFKDNATDTKIFARIATLSSYPLYYSECDLSKLKSSINITSNSETKLYTDGYYYINDSFSVAEQSLSKEITSIVVSYTNGSLETIYDGTNFVPFTSSDEGVYILTIVNKFGNKSLINVSYITKFSIVATANYFDGTNNIYSASYDGEINSNNSIELAVYTKHIEFSTTKDGNAITISTTDFNYGYKIIINEVGKYNFVITDEYGNTKNIVANIVNSTLNYNDNFITGFNEKALKKSDGYTNQKLSINLQAINDAGIKFISVSKSNSSVIVMDNISEDKIVPTSDSLNSCIGNLGDGIYTITFKDNYGNSVEKTINYKGTSTLSIYRETRTMEDKENVNIDKIENNSIYSNYLIEFTTSSSLFEFYVNDGKQDLPYTLQIYSTDSESENQYKVTYVDEYGFNYSLNAYLILRNIEFNVGEDMGESGVSNIVKHEIYITFEDYLYSSYTINNGDSVNYISGTKLYSNGTYRFSIFDNAGNISNYTVIKDTEVEYMFYKDGTTSPLVSGEVVNSTRVYFKSLNGDESTYKKVLKDGNIQEDYSSSYFTETGKWEILLQDKVGNTSYFNFYIITHSLSTFEYTTPYEYKITDLKFDDGSGSKVNRIADVTSSTDNLHSECKFNENGTYYVSMKNSNTGSIKTFQIYIDKNAPKVTLNGVLNGESTSKDVTISGYSEGDTIKVYKDNELIKTINVTSATMKSPTFSDKGSYKIIVSNVAGNTTELTFTRNYTANATTSILIIIFISIISFVLFAGLIFRRSYRTE